MPNTQTCPHCQGPLDPAGRLAGQMVRCPRCRFVYPAPGEPACPPDSDKARPARESRLLTVGPDRYRAIRKLAGGQTEVYLVRHVHLNELCVIKEIKTPRARGGPVVARLLEEARAGFRVNHPNVVRVLDCDHADDRFYVVMEYAPGVSLADVLRDCGRLVWRQALWVAIQAAEGLAAIHSAGLVHRDVKPSNLLLCPDGVVKISDLGLVQPAIKEVTGGASEQGMILGTPGYMAPEQAEARDTVDGRADLYGLGAVLYHALTGKPPFADRRTLDLIAEPAREPPTWPVDVAEIVPEWFQALITRCLEPKRNARWATAEALLRHVREALGVTDLAGVPAAPPLVRPPGVAVLAFRNVGGRPADDWIGDALAERLQSRLLESADVYIVDRYEFDELLQRKRKRREGRFQRHMAEVARLLGATVVVHGSFECREDHLDVRAELFELDQRRVRFLARAGGRLQEILGAEDQFAEAAVRALRDSGVRAQSDGAFPAGTRSARAQEKFVKAQRAFANGQYLAAADLAAEALAEDANYFEPLSFIGACQARLGEYDRALEWHRRAERGATLQGNEYRLAEVMNNLGVMCYYKGEYEQALRHLDQAKQIESNRSLLPLQAKTANNLGFVLLRMGKPAEAETAFQTAVRLNRELQSLAALIMPYNGLGSALLEQERYAEAADYHRRALTLAEELDERVKIGVAHQNLGRCRGLMNRHEQALEEFRRALDAFSETDFWNGRAVVYEHLGDAYLQLGQFTEALRSIDKRLELAARHGRSRMEAGAWEQRAYVLAKAGRTDEALACLEKAVDLAPEAAHHEDVEQYLQAVLTRMPYLRRRTGNTGQREPTA